MVWWAAGIPGPVIRLMFSITTACVIWSTPPRLPRYGVRRRFACALATIMIVAAAWGFQAGMPMVGSIVGWSLVAAAFVNVSTGFCIPSFIVRIFFGKMACS